jgi:type IV fimbrial biogenesis protein FimT
MGFTVIELIVTVAVAAILVSIAVPAVQNMIRDNSITAATNQLVTSLNYARNEALIEHNIVRVCRSDDPQATTPGCTVSGSNGYTKGWLIYVDADSDGVFDASKGDTLLRRVTLDNTNTITINGSPSSTPSAADQVGFTPMGMLAGASGTSAPYIVLCDDRGWTNGGLRARVIGITLQGRIAAAPGDSASQTAIGTSATSCTPS